jgi:beta-lactamase class A
VHRIPGVTGYILQLPAINQTVAALRAGDLFPAASLLKLLILIAALKVRDQGGVLQRFHLTSEQRKQISSALPNDVLEGKESLAVDELLRLMIVESDNEAADIIILGIGARKINTVALSLGLKITRVHGLFAEIQGSRRNGLTTPGEVATMLSVLASKHDSFLSDASRALSISLLLRQRDKRMIPSGLPKATIVANKTGQMDGVRNDAAIICPGDASPAILVVLVKDLVVEELVVGNGEKLSQYDPGIFGIHLIAQEAYDGLALANWQCHHST